MPRFRPAARSLDPSLDRQGKANRDRLRAAFVTSLVAMTTGVCPAQIQSRTRNKAEAARARQIAMYLSHVSFEWPLARVGAAFGRDRTTASRLAWGKIDTAVVHPLIFVNPFAFPPGT
jgi:chromosomal replication initiation ATPase DnaA